MNRLKRLISFSTALFLSLSSLLILVPAVTNAATCDTTGGGGAGGIPQLYLATDSSAIPDTTQKVSIEANPVTSWTTVGSGLFSGVNFANTDCTSANSSVSFNLDKSNVFSATFYDTNRTTPFVQGTDYMNLDASATVTPQGNNSAKVSTTLSSLPIGTPQLMSVDLSNAGWVDIYLKTGSGTDTRLVSFKAATGATKFLNNNGGGISVGYNVEDPAWTSCDTITGSAQTDVRVLYDGVAADQTAIPAGSSTCSSFIKTSVNATTKTASLAYDIAGAVPDHNFKSDNTVIPSGLGISWLSSLNYDTTNKYFTDYFLSSNNTAQQFYLTAGAYADGKNIPKDSTYPVVGGIIDFSQADIDLAAKQVTFDTISTDAQHAAFAHNVNTITKDGTFTLFIPFKAGDKSVGICPGATSLDTLKAGCTDLYYLKDGDSKTHTDFAGIPAGATVKATLVTVGGVQFWQVDGLTGTGGFSAPIGVPNTGFKMLAAHPIVTMLTTSLLAIGIAFVARRYNKISAR